MDEETNVIEFPAKAVPAPTVDQNYLDREDANYRKMRRRGIDEDTVMEILLQARRINGVA